MKHVTHFSTLETAIEAARLTNGECIMLAVQLLERCTKTPRTKLGRLFDCCLEGLQLLAAVGKAASMD